MAEGREQTPTVIHVRAEQQQRDLIDRAADRIGRSRESFVLDAACQRAEDIVLDQVFFPLGDRAFAAFLDLVEDPPPPSEALHALLLTKAPWG